MTKPTPKRPRGRPPSAPETHASARLDIRTPETQRAAYDVAARAAGYTRTDDDGRTRVLTAEWARDVLDAAAAGTEAAAAARRIGWRAGLEAAARAALTMAAAEE